MDRWAKDAMRQQQQSDMNPHRLALQAFATPMHSLGKAQELAKEKSILSVPCQLRLHLTTQHGFFPRVKVWVDILKGLKGLRCHLLNNTSELIPTPDSAGCADNLRSV